MSSGIHWSYLFGTHKHLAIEQTSRDILSGCRESWPCPGIACQQSLHSHLSCGFSHDRSRGLGLSDRVGTGCNQCDGIGFQCDLVRPLQTHGAQIRGRLSHFLFVSLAHLLYPNSRNTPPSTRTSSLSRSTSTKRPWSPFAAQKLGKVGISCSLKEEIVDEMDIKVMPTFILIKDREQIVRVPAKTCPTFPRYPLPQRKYLSLWASWFVCACAEIVQEWKAEQAYSLLPTLAHYNVVKLASWGYFCGQTLFLLGPPGGKCPRPASGSDQQVQVRPQPTAFLSTAPHSFCPSVHASAQGSIPANLLYSPPPGIFRNPIG